MVEYSFNGGTTWSTSNVPPTQGAVSVEVRQRDLAGIQGLASTAFAFTYDTVRPTVTVYSLSPDTGSSATDQVTNNTSPTLTFTFSEPVYGANTNVTVTNAALASITPTSITGWGTSTLSMTFTTLPDSVYTVTLDGSSAARSRILAGNVINGNQGNGNHVVTFQVDTVAPAIPGITGLTTDTGSSSTDKLTSNPALTVTGTEANAVVEYSFNGGTTWSTSNVPPTQGEVTVIVRQRDLAGNQGLASTAFTYTYDSVAPAIPGITGLTTDTGSSSTGNVTSNPALTLTGTEANAVVEYSFNGTTWSTSNVPPTQGAVTVIVRQRDLAGNQGSASTAFAYTYSVRPTVTVYSLSPDTGSSDQPGHQQHVAHPDLHVQRAGLRRQRQRDRHQRGARLDHPDIHHGVGHRHAEHDLHDPSRQVYTVTLDGSSAAPIKDLAGNIINGNQGNGNHVVTFQVDTAAPAIPGITGLTTDTGSSSTDKLTSNPALTVTGTKANAVVEYSFDGGTTWSTSLVPPTQGAVSVEVRQRDLAGNQGLASTAFAYTYDSLVPVIPGITGLTADTGGSSTDKVTSNPALTLAGTEVNAVVEYSFNGGTTWSTSLVPSAQGVVQ